MNALRDRLLQRLAAARAHTDALFAGLGDALLYERPIAERHRLIFYLGHLEAFDWNLLAPRLSQAASPNAGFDRLFAFGIDPLGGALPRDPASDWPSRSAVLHYTAQVRSRLAELLAAAPMQHPSPWASAPGRADAACWLSAAIEHRLMHAETLAYLLHRLPLGSFSDPAAAAEIASSANTPEPAAEFIRVPAGPVRLGQDAANPAAFGWDNEYPQSTVEVPAFDIARFMVSNGQYLRFVDAGGYDNPAHWQAADWAWKCAQGIAHPGFWRREGSRWRLRTMFDERPLPLDQPVYLSHAEARAYARWAGLALPSEAQWMRAAQGVTQSSLTLGADYEEALGPPRGNVDFQRWGAQPVHADASASEWGVQGLYGNGWEWTSTPFGPAAGFQAFEFYPGYSQDFFDGRHFVLKGGSARTAACMLRPSYRNWFQPHYQHVYAGLRCVVRDDRADTSEGLA